MVIKRICIFSILYFSFAATLLADDKGHVDHHQQEHGGQIFHKFQLEAAYGRTEHEEDFYKWHFDGWIGTDKHKLWIKSEAENIDADFEQLEFWVMYSRNIATFWDLQIGVRHDFKPDVLTHFVIGFEGLAPQFFETEAHLFISEKGDVTARIHQEIEFLMTQKLILEPFYELNFSAQDIEEVHLGKGVTEGEVGLQLRYQITPWLAPYIEGKYEQKFGKTKRLARDEGEEYKSFISLAGVRILF